MLKIFMPFSLIILLAGCSSIAQGNREYTQKKQDVLNTISFLENQGFVAMKGFNRENHLYFKAQVNDQEAEILLDSGASESFINYSKAKELGVITEIEKTIEQTLYTSFGTVDKGAEVKLESFDIPGLSFTNWPIHLLNSRYKNLLIGLNFLKSNKSILFCKYGVLLNSVLETPADSLETVLKKNGYVSAPLVDFSGNKVKLEDYEKNNGLFYVKVKANYRAKANCSTEANDREELFLLDTGGAFSSIHDTYLNFYLPTVKRTNIRVADSAGKSKELYMIPLESLKINNHLFLDNQNISLVSEEFFAGSGQTYGVLALDFLLQQEAIIDFGNGILYFKEAEDLL